MNYKLFDNSRLEEKIIDKILYNEVVYKEEKGEAVLAKKRHGRLDEESIYPNRKVINTRNGINPFNVQIKVYFRAFTDTDSVIIIDIFDYDTRNLIKKFTIKSINNKYSLNDMKSLINEITTLLDENDNEDTESTNSKTVMLIEFIRNKENLLFEEVAQ